ncbi:MAG: hypothetical protein ACT6FC_07250, partial [Methanosarcinaceae archaeon]
MGLLDYDIKSKESRNGLLRSAPTPNHSHDLIEEGHAVAMERAGGSRALLLSLTDDDYAEMGRESFKEKRGGLLKSMASATLGGLVDVGETFARAGRALPGGSEAGVGQRGT